MSSTAAKEQAGAFPDKSELVRRLSYPDDAPVAQQPFLIAGPAALWLIVAGKVDILLAQVSLRGELTERRYLFSVGAGQLLCGLGLSPLDNPAELVAIGSPDLRLRKLTVPELFALGNGPADATTQQKTGPERIDEWLGLLAHSSRVLAGTLQLPPVPNFASLDQAAEVETALIDCHRTLIKALADGQHKERRQERAQLRALAHLDAKLAHKSLSVLALVLADKQSGESLSWDQGNPLYAACQRVWGALGIEVGALPALGPQHAAQDPVLALAHLARLRVRTVSLSGPWWKHDHGPLLAIRRATGNPVALLPSGARSYDLYDDQRGTREAVTRAVAQTLAAQAYCFYRKLKEQPLTFSDVFRFCLVGTRAELLTVGLLGVGSGLLAVVPPYVTGLLFDTVIPGAQRGQLLQLCLALVMSAVTVGLFEVSRSLSIQRVEGKLSAVLNAAIWDRLLSLPVRFFRSFSAGDLAQRAYGIQQIFAQLSAQTISTLLAGFYGIFNGVLMFSYNPSHALLALGLVLFMVLITVVSGIRQLQLQRPLAAMHGHLSSVVLQLIAGIAKLRVTGAETRAFASWVKEFAQVRRLSFLTRSPLQVFGAVYPLVALMVLYWVVGSAPGPRSAGRFLGFLAAFQSCLAMTLSAAQSLLGLANLGPVFDRLSPLLTTMPEIEPNKVYPGVLTGEIELAHVSFRYQPDGPAILDDLSLRIEAGEFVAITGPSGSGKSTLLRLLLGFDKPAAGAIYYDRQDLSTLDLGAVRRQLGVVLQDGKLMAGSIFENIVGSANLTPADATEAARLAGFDHDLAQLPMGLHTHVEQGGSTLSGGQRQRLLIARAIVYRPRILYFDEATSALDNKTQAAVAASIDGLSATRVVIAHRLSTIRNADRIIVLQAGRIVQSGTYRELIAQTGPFAELAHRQLVEEGSPPKPQEP